MHAETQRLQQQCSDSLAASAAASARLDAIHSNVSSLVEAVGLGECDDVSIEDTFTSLLSSTRSACAEVVTSRALAVVSQTSSRSLSMRLADLQTELDAAAATCASKAEEAEHWEACMIDAEEQLRRERARVRELEASHTALEEQVEFLQEQEQQRHVSLLASLSPVCSPYALHLNTAVEDQTLSLLADHIIDARSQAATLQVQCNSSFPAKIAHPHTFGCRSICSMPPSARCSPRRL